MEFSREDMGRIIGVTGRRVTQMADEGKIPRPVKGLYDAPAVVRALVTAAKGRREPTPLEEEQAKVAALKAAEVELRVQARRGELLSVDVAIEIIDRFAALVRSEIAGLAARVTRDVALRRRIEEETNASLHRIASGCASAGVDLRAGGGAPDAEAEDDA